jgi:hypothetical protein
VRYYRIDIARPDGTPFFFKSLGTQTRTPPNPGGPLRQGTTGPFISTSDPFSGKPITLVNSNVLPGIPALTSLLPNHPQNPINGQANPAALNIEFDIPVAPFHAPGGAAWLRVWGLGVADIGNASNLNGMSVAVYAGMSKGLPLANPQQAGLIMQGKILQAWGNWIGTAQTVDLHFIPGSNLGSPDTPANVPFTWQAGTPLATAIAQTLSIAMPGVTQQINISPKLVLNYDVTGWYQSMQQFADFINELSTGIIGNAPAFGSLNIIGGAAYNGVVISTNGQMVRVADGTSPTQATAIKAIAFQDLLGQPTWLEPGIISIKTVLRADLQIMDTISLPPSLVTVGNVDAAQYVASISQPANRTAFSGNFQIAQIHHYGNFRQADAESWNTTIQAYPTNVASPPAALANGPVDI